MPHFYLHLLESDCILDDLEGLTFTDEAAASADVVRQIRRMLSCEIAETGQIDLRRAIDLAGPNGTRRMSFSDAVTLAL